MLFLKIIHIIMSIGVIAGVLLQSGKSAGLSGAISGGASSLFGNENKALNEKLSKLTTVAAVLFMLTSLLLAAL
ncbi:preprotein translocase subunit SecG [Selenihalanaerobacter shriftii]|uniref:Protein-export membrane protein SecG n=1 Tax=Selenihalanaerobacter shriftii TaxID=142842 RepID=A0A1T4KG86_9FIRM|nr:preprotein translocase subunit SecG [Selenihalanaerobacter shriftii]SJZ41429.1 preprotein translocase subunit SecG [Selenihalanaerobacter shriftii]